MLKDRRSATVHKTRSKQPRKQRRALYNAPLHLRQKLVRAPLSTDLRGEYRKRSVQVRTGDSVLIMRGDNRGKEGKVQKVDLKSVKIWVEGLVIAKSDGTEVPRAIHPSNVMITKLNLDDEERIKILERK